MVVAAAACGAWCSCLYCEVLVSTGVADQCVKAPARSD